MSRGMGAAIEILQTMQEDLTRNQLVFVIESIRDSVEDIELVDKLNDFVKEIK